MWKLSFYVSLLVITYYVKRLSRARFGGSDNLVLDNIFFLFISTLKV